MIIVQLSRALQAEKTDDDKDLLNFTNFIVHLHSFAAMENITEKINELKKLVSEFKKSVPELKAAEIGVYRKQINEQIKELESVISELKEIQSDLNKVSSEKSDKTHSEKYVLAPDIEDPFQS